MRAVNLIPGDARRASGLVSRGPLGPAYAVLGLLTIALAFMTLYVFATNSISQRRATLSTLQQEVAQEQARASGLSDYARFQKLAQARAQAVRQIAAGRFDWQPALADLSRVVPAAGALQSLVGTVAPGVSVSGAGGSTGGSGISTGSLRADIRAPAFELRGCTRTQDDVARLLSRLRLINDVQRVTLGDSVKQDSGGAAATAGAASASPGSAGAGGCGANTPSFDLVVFFKPLPGAVSPGASSAASPIVPATAATAATPQPVGTPSSTPTPTTQQVSSTPATSGGPK